MPPEGPPLSPYQVELIKRWIEQGADWTEHWSFEPPRRHAVPTVKHEQWIHNPIDAFVLSKLERNGLVPAHPASKVELLRRIT